MILSPSFSRGIFLAEISQNPLQFEGRYVIIKISALRKGHFVDEAD